MTEELVQRVMLADFRFYERNPSNRVVNIEDIELGHRETLMGYRRNGIAFTLNRSSQFGWADVIYEQLPK